MIRLEDVKENVSEAPAATGEETSGQEAQPAEQTTVEPEAPASQEAQERMVPISVVQKERKQRQDLQRKLAEYESQSQLDQYDPTDTEAILAHPFVQELLIKQGKQELTDYAREVLEEYGDLHPQVKKAILRNARGFVNETTTDVESAKIDLLEYIESIAEEAAAQPQAQPKTFPIASTNATADHSGVRPAEIAKIIAKPVDSWTDAEEEAVKAYSKNNPNK